MSFVLLNVHIHFSLQFWRVGVLLGGEQQITFSVRMQLVQILSGEHVKISIIIRTKKIASKQTNKQNQSYLFNKVVSIYQDIREQRLPLEPSGGVSQPVPVHLSAAPECQIGVHRSLCAASSLHSGW